MTLHTFLAAAVALGLTASAGAASTDAEAPRSRASTVKFGVDRVLLEVGQLGSDPAVDTIGHVRATPEVLWRPARSWEIQGAVMLEATTQSGGAQSYDLQRARAGDTFVRYRSGDTRLTAGWQTIVWARVDETPLIDRVSRTRLDRLWLDDLELRRLPLPALRWEQDFENWALDIVALPTHRGGLLPDARSVWHPVDSARGEIAGLDLPPQIAQFVRGATLDRASNGTGGLAVRLRGEADDGPAWGVTLSRTRQSLPFFVADVSQGTLVETHPLTRFTGLDAEWSSGGTTWRTELGLTWDAPVTTRDGSAQERKLLEWIAGAEMYPGDGDLRVNLQFAARSIRSQDALLERREMYVLGGELELPLDKGRWKLGLRFGSALNVHDVYLAPRVVFAGWEPHEIYLTAHTFDGATGTLGGFHRRHDVVVLGLKTRF